METKSSALHSQVLLKHEKLTRSHFKFDRSFTTVDPREWNSYTPFLISSLGLTSEEDKKTITGLKITDSAQWSTCDFIIDYSDGEKTYTESYIQGQM